MKKPILLSILLMFFLMTSIFGSSKSDTTKMKKTDTISYVKLTQQQYEDLIRAKIENESKSNQDKPIFIDESNGVKHSFPFIFVIIIVIVISVSKHMRQKKMQELHMKYLETGKEIPADLNKIFKEYRNSHLKRAVILITIGLGMMLSLFLIVPSNEPNIWTIGLIPLFVGLGFLIVHFFEKKS